MPFVNACLLVELVALVVPRWSALRHGGPAGRAKLARASALLGIVLAAFQGWGVFVLGAVLERFFARYVTLNSFTESVVRTVDRGEIARWPARIGNRALV